jgi:hypothetical protein
LGGRGIDDPRRPQQALLAPSLLPVTPVSRLAACA